MKHISESKPELKEIKPDNKLGKNYDEEKCVVCGATVKFNENEYKKPCKNCGIWVFERKKQANIQSKKIGCWICLDNGVVEYPLQKDGCMYKYVARCSCPKGMSWPGTIPLLEQCQNAPSAGYIEYQNRKMLQKGVMGNESI